MRIKLPALLTLGLFFLPLETALAAPRLFFEPASTNLQKDYSYEATVKIDVESQSAFGADAVISYNPDNLEITGVANGGFFSDFGSANDTAAGRLELHGYFGSLFDSKSGSGILAKFSVKAKTNNGSDQLVFVCNSNSNSSQILNTSGQNIISCSSLNRFSLTYTGAPTATATLTPIPTATQKPQPTATSAPPQPGNIDPVCTGLSVSPSSAKTPATITFTCIGNDDDGQVTAAEFNFGNGTTQLVENNARPGGISTTFTYQTAAVYQPTCRVRDDRNRFSSIPADCRKSVNITRTSSSPTTKPAATATRRPTRAPTEAPTPTVSTDTQEIVFSHFISPTPGLDNFTDTTTAEETETGSTNLPRLLVGMAIILFSLGLGMYLINRAKKDNNPPSSIPPLVKE